MSAAKRPVRLLLADDHAVLRSGLRLLLGTQRDMEVVGEAADGLDAARKAGELRPDVVLMDLSMPGPPSGDTIREVLRQSPESRVLVLTMHDDLAYLDAALAAGAAGYVVKKVADTELLSAIRAVHGGRMFVDLTRVVNLALDGSKSGAAGGARRPADRRPPPKGLSKREREVLGLLAQGHSKQQVADRIGVSVKTVETCRRRLSEKLGLKGRAALFRFASESGFLDLGEAPSPKKR